MNFASYTFLALQTKSSETWRRRHEKSRDEGTHNIKIVKFCETLISYNSLKEHSPALLLYGTLQTKQQPAQGYIWEEAYFYSLFEYVISYKFKILQPIWKAENNSPNGLVHLEFL